SRLRLPPPQARQPTRASRRLIWPPPVRFARAFRPPWPRCAPRRLTRALTSTNATTFRRIGRRPSGGGTTRASPRSNAVMTPTQGAGRVQGDGGLGYPAARRRVAVDLRVPGAADEDGAVWMHAEAPAGIKGAAANEGLADHVAGDPDAVGVADED